jgi:serine protease inhibitor ecotin
MNLRSHIDLSTATEPVITPEAITAGSSLADTQPETAHLTAEAASRNINRPVYQILPQRNQSHFRVRYREGTSVSQDCTLCKSQ